MERSRVTRSQWEALNRCRQDSMRPLVELLQQAQTAETAKLLKADDEKQIYRLQGRISVLGTLIEMIEASPDHTR